VRVRAGVRPLIDRTVIRAWSGAARRNRRRFAPCGLTVTVRGV
jgi:hypothetical protein